MFDFALFFAFEQAVVLAAGFHGQFVFFPAADAPNVVKVDIVGVQACEGLFDLGDCLVGRIKFFRHPLGGHVQVLTLISHLADRKPENVLALVLAVARCGVQIGNALINRVPKQVGICLLRLFEIKPHSAKANRTDPKSGSSITVVNHMYPFKYQDTFYRTI